MNNNEIYRIEFTDGAVEISPRDDELEVNFFGLESLDHANMERVIQVFNKLSEGDL